MFSVFVKVVLLLFFIVIGVYSNGCVIYIVLLGDVYCFVLNFFVVSLSIVDLVSCFIVMFFIFVFLLFGEWVFGSSFCIIYVMLFIYFVKVVFFSVGVMMYERYWVIY